MTDTLSRLFKRIHGKVPVVSLAALLWLISSLLAVQAETQPTQVPMQWEDVFEMQTAVDPQPSPNGKQVVFVRQWMDKQTDRRRSSLWMMNANGEQLQALTAKEINASSPRWSPNGDRIAYVSAGQIHMLWLDSGRTAQISELPSSPGSLTWSPDGTQLAFSMFTAQSKPSPVQLPGKPMGATWAEPAKYIDDFTYRVDGAGYLPGGYQHIYTLPAHGGSVTQLTAGNYNHSGHLEWATDGKGLYFSADRHEDWQRQAPNSEIYYVSLQSKELTQLTDRQGPDAQPKVSPNGKWIAFVGYDDKGLSNQNSRLYVMSPDGSNVQLVTANLDRSIDDFYWQANSKGFIVSYDDYAQGVIATVSLQGKVKELARNLGGTYDSRPYSGGHVRVGYKDHIYYTISNPHAPAEIGSLQGSKFQQLTNLNQAWLDQRLVGQVEAFDYKSSVDELGLQGWVMYPPNFDPNKKYPLILEIHGGPFTAYGPYFAMELQLLAAQGYVVLYTNPRGSTSYGEDFANQIHHNYPSNDYHDLMDGVDAVIARGFINEDELFITGGSGGGLLTSWTVGHTDRFAAAVAVNPVINWYSFILNADMYNYFSRYWMPGLPWDMPEHYLKYSPISYVGQVNTPTMLLTGESDLRTPISETEQFYQALQLRGVESAMVRIPGGSHSLAIRPSNMMAKPAFIHYWFEKYRQTSS